MCTASSRKSTIFIIVVTAAVALALTLLLYRDTLYLALWADDLLQVPWVKDTPLRELWLTVGPYQDYRPLHFTLWRALTLFSALKPAALHALNLAGHALSSWLVGLLAARISKRPWAATLLGVSFFALFPFAYDTVLWVSSFSYPLTLILALSALLLYLQARNEGNRALHIPALLLTALAGFAYEGGVMAGPGVLLAELCLQERPFSRWSLAYVAASLLPFAAITIVSPAVPTEFLTGLHPLYNPVIALQALVFPIAQLAEPLARFTGLSAITSLIVLGMGALCGAAWLLIRRRATRGALFGLGWAVLWSVIPLTTQAFNWYRDPPRVFYLSAAGIALVWASVVEALPPLHWKAPLRSAAQALLSLALLAPGALWLRDEVTLHRRISALLWNTARQAEAQPGTLFINLPGRITFAERRYPLGHEGAIPLPPPTNGELWLAVHSDGAAHATTRALGAILPPTPYLLEMADADVDSAALRAATQIVQVRYRADALDLETTGAVLPAQAPPERAAATFSSPGGDILLLRKASCAQTGPEEITVDAEWQALTPLHGAPTVFVHWWSAGGALLAQADGDPLRGLYPLAQWQAGEIVQERRSIEAMVLEGSVALGIWDPEANARWQATDPAGETLPDGSFVLPSCSPPSPQMQAP